MWHLDFVEFLLESLIIDASRFGHGCGDGNRGNRLVVHFLHNHFALMLNLNKESPYSFFQKLEGKKCIM